MAPSHTYIYITYINGIYLHRYIRRFISKGEKSLKSVFALLKKMDNTLMLVRLPLSCVYMYICMFIEYTY